LIEHHQKKIYASFISHPSLEEGLANSFWLENCSECSRTFCRLHVLPYVSV